jgi:hypothetical protein
MSPDADAGFLLRFPPSSVVFSFTHSDDVVAGSFVTMVIVCSNCIRKKQHLDPLVTKPYKMNGMLSALSLTPS